MNQFRQAMAGVKPLKGKGSYQDWRQCSGKNPYFTFEEAQTKIDEAMEKRSIKLRCYTCDVCYAIHLTSKPKI